MKRPFFIFLLCASVVAYSFHQRSLHTAEEKAAERGREEARVEAEAEMEKERESRRKGDEARKGQERERVEGKRPLMSIAAVIEPWIAGVVAPLNLAEPADAVPPVEVIKQRVLEKRAKAEPARQVVYDRAAAFLDYLIALGEERTKVFEAVIRNRQSGPTTMGRPRTLQNNDFFNQSVVKRWEDTLSRARPILMQRLEELRKAEKEWNKTTDPNSVTEDYFLPPLAPVSIPPEQVVVAAVGTSAKSVAAARPWRQAYYQENDYRPPMLRQ